MKTIDSTAFSRERLHALWAIELREDVRRYGLQLLIGLGVILAIVLYMTYQSNYSNENNYYSYDPVAGTETFLFPLGLFIMGCLSGTYISAPLGNKASAISFLMIPASQQEKYITRLLIFVPGFFVAYMLGITIIDLMHYLVAIIHGGSPSSIELAITKEPIVGDYKDAGIFYLAFFFLQSAFALGGAVWPKHGVLSSMGAGFVLGFVYSVVVNSIVAAMIFMNVDFWDPFDFSEDTVIAICYAIGITAIITNYTLAYYRIKEAEIINRF